METSNIKAYRAQAEKCSRQSDLTDDTDSKLHLLDLADAWLKLADNLEKQDISDFRMIAH